MQGGKKYTIHHTTIIQEDEKIILILWITSITKKEIINWSLNINPPYREKTWCNDIFSQQKWDNFYQECGKRQIDMV